ncbi:MAG: ornithine carbamoyltransferase [Magnetococcales bacterium]|nr:ornithine carbamoyltransferase [Magnetococcales bacterium]
MTSKDHRDLLSLDDLSPAEMEQLLRRARELKQARQQKIPIDSLQGRMLGMIFEKASTRTRVSFEVGMLQLGGHALFLSAKETQMGRGETLEDSARVLSRYVDGLMVRTYAHERLRVLAQYASIPVINGLSDSFHPCQVLADLLTYQEHRGPITQRRVAWIGDGNNMANTWMQAAVLAGFHLTLACPDGYQPDAGLVTLTQQRLQGRSDASLTLVSDPVIAATDADLIITDTWTSMGQEQEQQQRLAAFSGYQVNEALMERTAQTSLFMHCLPAHRGEEVTSEVLDGPRSVVWDEAENRLHIQKAILEWLLS